MFFFIFSQFGYIKKNLGHALENITTTTENATQKITTEQIYMLIKQRNHIINIMKYNDFGINKYSMTLHNEYLKYYNENKIDLLDPPPEV